MTGILWLFLIYSFFGWCVEVMYFAFEKGQFVNRGYLAGPVCPIYGFGVLGVLALLMPIKGSLAVLFLGSVAITTLLELVTGFLMEKILHDKWWDYSNKPFNFHGYICLEFSVIWGIACVLAVDVIHPLVSRLLPTLESRAGVAVLIILLAAFAADFIITTVGIARFSRFVRAARDIEDKLSRLSDGIGGVLADGVIALEGKHEKFVESENVHRSRELLIKRRDELMQRSDAVVKRIFKAFPNLKNGRYNKLFRSMSDKFKRK